MKHSKLILSFGSLALALGSIIVAARATPAQPPRTAPVGDDIQLSFSRIYWEYNSSANDLGVHVTLDGENWKGLRIVNPSDKVLFEVRGRGPYKNLGMTELFFEGAEPSLDEFPLNHLLALFPQGVYEFEGLTVGGDEIEGEWEFTHAIPDGPEVFAFVGRNNYLRIEWNPVTSPPPGFPNEPIVITGYQIIVGSFQVTLPASATSVTVPQEFVASLAPGVQPFEVLAIDRSGNQTLTEGTFVK